MTYADELKELEDFVQLVESSESPPEFSMNCMLWAMPDWATKRFFDEKLFKFMFNNNGNHRGKVLKLKLQLRKNLSKLTSFYDVLLDDI